MIGLGTLINTGLIVAGGIFGHFFGKLLKERHQDTLTKACGVSVLFISIAGAMKEMLSFSEGRITTSHEMLLVVCIALGGLIGEIIDIEKGFERFGEWLKRKTGNSGDAKFVDGFLTASFTVCIGAMAIVGSIKDGIEGDWTILATKGILDLIIIIVLTGSMGKGCVFSAIPVFVLQGTVTVAAALIKTSMNPLSIAYISAVGNVLIFCVGINLVWGKKVRVANLLPALIFAGAAAYLPFSL